MAITKRQPSQHSMEVAGEGHVKWQMAGLIRSCARCGAVAAAEVGGGRRKLGGNDDDHGMLSCSHIVICRYGDISRVSQLRKGFPTWKNSVAEWSE